VTAVFNVSGNGASGKCFVNFTSDKAAANTDQNNDEWVEINTTGLLQYSEDSRIAEAYTKPNSRGVTFAFRGFSIIADSIQVDLQLSVLKARNAVVSYNGVKIAEASMLNFDYGAFKGTGVVTDPTADHNIHTVEFVGQVPKVNIVDQSKAPSGTVYQYLDLSEDHVIVSAVSLSMKPGDDIQLRRSTVFIDGQKIVSLPIDRVPLNATEVFGQQVFGYGTDGVYLNFPYYLSDTHSTLDTLFIRSKSAEVQSGAKTHSTGTFTLDYDHSYKIGTNRGNGDFMLFGIQQGSATGIRWRHNQGLDRFTSVYFYIDNPSRNSIFTSASIGHQFTGFSMNGVESYGHSVSTEGATSDTQTSNLYADSTPRKVMGGGQYAVKGVMDVSEATSSSRQEYNGSVGKGRSETQTLTERFFTAPIKFGNSLSFSDSFRIGGTHDVYGDDSAVTWESDLGLQKTVSKTSTANLSYTYTHNPLSTSLRYENNQYVTLYIPDIQRLSSTYSTGSTNGLWAFSVTGDYTYPTLDHDLMTSFMYNPFHGTRLSFNSMYSYNAGFWYRDYGVGLVQRFLTRDVSCSWSLVDHMIRLNVNSAGF
jgi:hypothetical protein